MNASSGERARGSAALAAPIWWQNIVLRVTIEVGYLPWQSGLAAALARTPLHCFFYEQRLMFTFLTAKSLSQSMLRGENTSLGDKKECRTLSNRFRVNCFVMGCAYRDTRTRRGRSKGLVWRPVRASTPFPFSKHSYEVTRSCPGVSFSCRLAVFPTRSMQVKNAHACVFRTKPEMSGKGQQEGLVRSSSWGTASLPNTGSKKY